jgi:hypothetical protein
MIYLNYNHRNLKAHLQIKQCIYHKFVYIFSVLMYQDSPIIFIINPFFVFIINK